MRIRLPNRFTRAQFLAYLARSLAIVIFIITLLISNEVLGIGRLDDDGFFNDTIDRITSDRADVVAVIAINVFGYLILVTGLYLAMTLYITANTMTSTSNIERDVAVIRQLLKEQVGERALQIEANTLEDLRTSGMTVNLVRVGTVAAVVILVCVVIVYIASLFIPVEEEAPPYVVAAGCEINDEQDSDCDGIPNDEEAWIAENYAPIYIYDNEEHNLVLKTDDFQEFRDVIYFSQVSPVHCNTKQNIIEASPTNDVLLTIVATYTYDYIPLGTSAEVNELDVLDHFGDTERIRICIERTVKEGTEIEEFQGGFGEDSSIEHKVAFVQINRHAYFNTYTPDSLIWADGNHFYVHISEGKHATYISAEECIAHPRDVTALAFHEDCTNFDVATTVIRPSLANLNVGEVGAQLIKSTDELVETQKLMFGLTESIWLDIQFCGGYPPEDLLAVGQTPQLQELVDESDAQYLAILDTLLPFIDLESGRISEVCGGSLQSKWWGATDTAETLN